MFFALFIVTLFTASFSLGRYSSVQSSESNYDDDFEYTLYDSIVVNTIDEFFAAISNGYNYIIIGDAIKDPLIIAGSMSDIRDDLIIDLNGHEIQRNSRDPLLNVTTGFALTIIDRVGTGSMYNPVGSVIQVSGGTLTVQNGIFESGPRSDDSRNGVSDENYNEYATTDNNNNWVTDGGGSISGGTSGTAQVTVYRNSNIGSENTSNTYGDSIGTVALPIITPKATGRGVVNGSMYFDDAEEERIYYTCNGYNVIKDDTYLYYTYEADNMQYSTVADKSTANYYYRYYVNGGELGDTQDSVNSYFAYASDQTLKDPNDSSDQRILVTVYVFNDVKYYAAEQSGYKDSSGTSGFGAVKMQSGNLYVRGGTYYSYFGEENTFGVQSTGGLMSVNPTGSNAINFYAYQNGVCVDCRTSSSNTNTPVNEMLNISSGNFYSELGDTVRVENGHLVIGTADFTKDVGSYSGETTTTWGRNGSVINISGGTLTINNSADFDITGSYINGIYSHKGDAETRVTVTNATFTFNGTNNSHHNCGIYAEDGNVSCRGNTTINLSNGASNNRGIYSAGNGYIAFGLSGDNVTTRQTTITVANGQSANNYGIYSTGGRIYGYGTTNITLGADGSYSTNSQGIYSTGGTITLGRENSQDKTTITVYGNNSATGYSTGNFGIQTSSGTINAHGAIDIDVTGVSSSGILATTGSTINVYGVIDCTIDMASSDSVNRELSSPAVYVNGGNIVINSTATTEETHSTITSDGFGLVVNDGDITVTNGRIDVTTTRTTAVYLTGGKLDIAEAATMNVNSRINADCEWAMGDDASLQGANIYNGVYVRGGSLISNGTLNVEHVGVANDSVLNNDGSKNTEGNNAHITAERSYNQGNAQNSDDGLPIYNSTNAYYEFAIKSYAVRVEAATGSTSTVTITKGNIVNQVTGSDGNQVGGGGGIYVSGGTVTLGQQGATAENDLSISATGTDAFAQYFHVTNASTNWSARLPRTGGHAVQVTGGTLTINSGTYNSALGNGILLTNGNITVKGGTIVGGDDEYNSSQRQYPPCGAAASYCLKVCGGEIDIQDGIFGSPKTVTATNALVPSSGAFIMGISADNRGTANISKGTFNVGGQSAFAVYQHATVTFGSQATTNQNDDIYVRGLAAGLTVENSPESSIFVTIYNGEFRGFRNGNGDGIWFGNRYALTRIFGGQFIGESRYGLNIDDGGRLQISGGTIQGEQYGINVSLTRLVDAPMAIDSTRRTVGDTVLDISGTANISGYQAGLRVSALYATTDDANCIEISGGTFSGTNADDSAGLRLDTALNATNIVHITGGTFTGYYGGYYGVDGANGIDDGLLIEGNSTAFTGTQYGFYFADNPWSGTIANPTNNVAIIGGTFSATNPNGEAIQGLNNDISTGDVFTEHTGDLRYGISEEANIYGNVGPGTSTGGYAINNINSNRFTLETRP